LSLFFVLKKDYFFKNFLYLCVHNLKNKKAKNSYA